MSNSMAADFSHDPSATEEAFNQSLVRAYLNSSWMTVFSAGFLIFVSLLSTVLIPSQASMIKVGVVQISWMLGLCGGFAAVVRVLRMPYELRIQANLAELGAQLFGASIVTLFAATPYLIMLFFGAMAWITSLF